jgi:hypothetical protein
MRQLHDLLQRPDVIRHARLHGVNVNREYAEVFQVYRVVA